MTTNHDMSECQSATSEQCSIRVFYFYRFQAASSSDLRLCGPVGGVLPSVFCDTILEISSLHTRHGGTGGADEKGEKIKKLKQVKI